MAGIGGGGRATRQTPWWAGEVPLHHPGRAREFGRTPV